MPKRLSRTPTPSELAAAETASPSFGLGHNQPPSPIAEGVSYATTPRPPPELEPDDVLLRGERIHDYLVALTGLDQSLSATYYQIKKGWIPALKYAGHLIGSKRAIAQRLAAGAGLAA
jgi:hypothetical protein